MTEGCWSPGSRRSVIPRLAVAYYPTTTSPCIPCVVMRVVNKTVVAMNFCCRLCHLIVLISLIEANARSRCGGVSTAIRGVIQSPNFPHRFQVPIHCEWVIDATQFAAEDSAIYVYLTQLYVFEGLSFKEYQIYDQSYQLNGRDVHAVTEANVTRVSYVRSASDFLVITLKLDSIESVHLRVLDHILDVYGFNVTYEIKSGPPRSNRCTMLDCGFTGTCYDYFTHFQCNCFAGYEGKQCSEGPSSLCTNSSCQNGGKCIHVGDLSVRCVCPSGFTGKECEQKLEDALTNVAFTSCAHRGGSKDVCNCPKGESLHDPNGHMEIVSHSAESIILNGHKVVLSCTHRFRNPHAVSNSTFQWFKDGVRINASVTKRKWTKLLLSNVSSDEYEMLLGIGRIGPIDEGLFVCRVMEDDIQSCHKKRILVRTPPNVWIEPMSLTVRKGENFTIKCFTAPASSDYNAKFTYSWTKNKELLPIKTDGEHYEVLYPMGSILQVSSISKSTTYSCLVHDAAIWAEQSIVVNVIDIDLVKTCPGERHSMLLWPETAPGTESLQECPTGYMGTAQRACNMHEIGRPTWFIPNFADCYANALVDVRQKLQQFSHGYEVGEPQLLLEDLKRYIGTKGTMLPGEGAAVVQLLNNAFIEFGNLFQNQMRTLALEIVDGILQRRYALTNESQVVLLQDIMKRLSLSFRGRYHRTLERIDVTAALPDKFGFHVPQSDVIYPRWCAFKVQLTLSGSRTELTNKSTLAVVVYKNLMSFLPSRSAIRLKDGIELEYEVISNIVGSWLFAHGEEIAYNHSDILFTMEFQHSAQNYSSTTWKVQCAVSDFARFGYAWDITACITRALGKTRTRCICPRAGTFALVATIRPSFIETEPMAARQLIIVVGCSISVLFLTITTLLLCLYWFRHRSSIAFLKLQCAACLLGAKLVFIYALWDQLNPGCYLIIMTLLETFLLTSISSQLSKLLIIYAELVSLSRIRNIKETVVLIITGAPMIAIFGNHLAHLTMNTRLHSWWLLVGSLSFQIFTVCCTVIVLLYVLLVYIITMKIYYTKKMLEKPPNMHHQRLQLVKRSVLIFSTTVAMIAMSLFFINTPDIEIYNYAFSIVIVLSGLNVFCAYILFAETSVRQLLLVSLNANNTKAAHELRDLDQNNLSFFAKERPQMENQCAPYSHANQMYIESNASCSFIASTTSCCDTVNGSGSESPDLLGTRTKCVDFDLVAGSCASTLPCITLTLPSNERPTPDGEEMCAPELAEQRSDNLDAVMVSIGHDLNYLLNDCEFEAESEKPGKATTRRLSKSQSVTIFEQIDEEPEEEVKLPEAITSVLRTNC